MGFEDANNSSGTGRGDLDWIRKEMPKFNIWLTTVATKPFLVYSTKDNARTPSVPLSRLRPVEYRRFIAKSSKLCLTELRWGLS